MISPRSLFTSRLVPGTLGLAVVALTGCPPPPDVTADTGVDASVGADTAVDNFVPSVDAESDVQPMDAAAVDAVTVDGEPAVDSGPSCPASPPEMRITSLEITSTQSWDCNHVYVLDTPSPIFVRGAGTVLNIGPGTIIRSSQPQAAIIITRGARIEAHGTASLPIVFTSNRPVGMRAAGDWGGIVLLGGASINNSANMTGTSGENQIEGLDSADLRGRYGGGASPDDASNCGTIRYARIEFAGYTLSPNNELNGLTVAGCGSATTLDFIQTHRGADDGVEIFGGTVNIRHIVSTQSDDDGLDWDQGWRGNGQFILVQGPALSGESDPSGIEADNDRDDNVATPASEPTLYNLSILGPGRTVSVANNRAMVLRRGTAGRLYNALVQGFPTSGIDVRDMATFNLANAARLAIGNSIISDNGPDGLGHFIDNAPDSFDETAWFNAAAAMNRTNVDPMMPMPYSATSPNFVPPAGSPAASGAITPTGVFFDATATFVGAIPPGSTTNWTTGWTSYPAN